MAKSASNEEIQLKNRARRRLIGAITLFTLIVIFLPMALDSRPKQAAKDINIQIPAKDSVAEFTSKIIPLTHTAVKDVPGQTLPGQAAPAGSSSVEKSQPVPEAKKPQTEKIQTANVAQAAKTESKPKTETRAENDGFVVQFGVFSDSRNVKQLQEKLSSNGIKSYTETLKTTEGKKTRVRAGPFSTRDAAEQTRDRLSKIGLNGIVAPK